MDNREAGDLRRHRSHYDVIVIGRRFGSTAAEVSTKCQNDMNSATMIHKVLASILNNADRLIKTISKSLTANGKPIN